MNILGLETSCDETAVALLQVQGDNFVLPINLVSSQINLHQKYGGVVPEVAARAHVETIFPLLQESGLAADGSGVDVIAVTGGPGLLPALRIGLETAKALAFAWHKPLVAVNHLEGHIYSPWLSAIKPSFPALALIVSGGHTEIVLVKDHLNYQIVGATRDDAAGEAFDKVAKLLGLGYPGGPAIAQQAQLGDPASIPFPRPMSDSGDFDFSFSGLKTAVAVYLKQHPEAPVADVAASFQQAAVDILVQKTLAAVKKFQPQALILGGGVSANLHLRKTLGESLTARHPAITYHVPNLEFTGDNAAMIAAAGYFHAQAKRFVNPVTLIASPNLRLK
ncbi:tRNA (adenosine(37)-N6)-threonylcarbamoyltransferase complex transferase subunit TsaD [Patescibacteria group bacterium]|nr:tRNA (adenosine(37)-N6)-threonylcarbamoyltransferase complex transferase subunit TsaD [Patescibacteria group bacterium]MBU1705278.1 tRNA (adenosine(37)-N6)-threonylcarbamoyltransferase complex transferase subunit TsaD [Patescibacteria group bacterium]